MKSIATPQALGEKGKEFLVYTTATYDIALFISLLIINLTTIINCHMLVFLFMNKNKSTYFKMKTFSSKFNQCSHSPSNESQKAKASIKHIL